MKYFIVIEEGKELYRGRPGSLISLVMIIIAREINTMDHYSWHSQQA